MILVNAVTEFVHMLILYHSIGTAENGERTRV